MQPKPQDEMAEYNGRDLLAHRKAIITGGDSGIGRAVAVAFAKEGADIAIAYLSEHDDAEHTADLVRKAGRRCVLLPGDLADPRHCRDVVEHPEEISDEHWRRTFDVNIHSYFSVTKAALPHMKRHDAIINTGS
jgi:NAD(P)-dependent dehydrogenase (short-subunit alcohol dehydrogenase family)